ncbi:unnamed protein product [Haemonchus placei]|uniref:EF-hand domain-containing protein n=1 Tax=Haemonchus placei TaxID=6290 RepID=A0A0N4W1B1_HAEPC|nr:unnamed protein product [Haemonchus placei]
MDDQKIRYQPESLDILMEKTHFSKFELKYLYQCFKQNCPSGYVTREQFIAIFRSFFSIHRLSDATQYAELVFNTFDDDRNNRISFSEFAILLSLFSKGTLEQRLEWLFDLYDCNGRGYIVEEDHITKLDRDKSGKITRAEFIQGCLSDPNIITSMEVLRSVW